MVTTQKQLYSNLHMFIKTKYSIIIEKCSFQKQIVLNQRFSNVFRGIKREHCEEMG